ncbi:multicopper oxidase domain-containing protein [Haloarchaeobius sp. HRN-SO-5]|uniref:multicopper oxidase domain-containing protein n=1 Tax=Haloarchaeobius sp. HRN-SO-5 TaxID=3446118 RepID=UPI003EB8D4E4
MSQNGADDAGTDDASAADEAADTGTFVSSRRSVLAGTGTLATGLGTLPNGAFADSGQGTTQVPNEPDENGQVREYTVHAIEVDIPFNQFGLHQPKGTMYVLEEDLDAANEASGTLPNDGYEAVDGDEQRVDFYSSVDGDGGDECIDSEHIDLDGSRTSTPGRVDDGPDTSVLQPLVIRANEGDVVEIEFHNDLDRRASIHQTGLPYDVGDSDGAKVGNNPDTTVAPGESTTYRWYASHQGGHFFYDLANPAMDSADQPPQVANLLSRGLFGTMMVEPPGATWTDPFTGEELRSGVQADIHDPEFLGTSYREIVVHYHTPEGIQPDITFPQSDTPQTTHSINYRADPTGQRVAQERADELGLDPDILKEFFYNSWVNGDPGGGDTMYPVYKGDPMKFVAVGASTEENHVHHLHAHRWKTVPTRSDSDTIDSQTLGLGATYPVYFTAGHGAAQGSAASGPIQTVRPDMTFEEAFEIGAGGAHGTAGDNIFHCHLFPHYGEGMWSGFRIFDKEICGLEPLPSTTIAEDPVPDEVPFREGILPEESDIPGFPDFVPGNVGSPPPDSPLATGENPLEDGRQPTAEEQEALGDIVPGAPYADPCDPFVDNTEFGGPPAGDDAPVKEYTIVVLPANIVYNDEGDHDPDGIIYVLEEDAEAVRNGELNPEPLFIRANVGDCVDVTVKNETSAPVSVHPHFVSFDLLGSDSLAMGYNYDQDTEPGGQRTYRWYADEEGPIFFHDHIFGIDDSMHGEFCALIVEPEGSEYLDPYSGDPIRSGAQAIIETPDDQNDFREFCLHLQDFAQLRDRDGQFVNPEFEHNENAGTMGINLRNAPLYHRDDEDPAYTFSSAVHGDPPTPTLEAYSNDPVRIRLLQGVWEEQHNFHLHGRPFEPEGLAVQDTVSQIIGTSEQFTFHIDPNEQEFEQQDNPFGLPIRDHLYGSSVVDDLWTGMWGIHRVFGARTPHLEPLPDRGPPGENRGPDGGQGTDRRPITPGDLLRMGHFAPFVGLGRLNRLGQRALLLYDQNDDREFPPDKDARQNRNVGEIPPQARDPGDPCPDDADVRRFDVTAFQTEIEFNEYGDVDPHGIVYALDDHVEDIKNGDRPAEPLVIRANQGDCIEINLTNDLEDFDNDHAHPLMRVEQDWEASNRISLHAQRVVHDTNGSDGTTVGFNFDQTVAPGETITYRWYAQDEFEFVVLWDMADVRSHRHHGSFGGLVVEPQDATWLDTRTAEPLPAGSGTMLTDVEEDAREFTLSFSDARFIVNEDDPDNCVVPPGPDTENPDAPCNQIGDREDQGYPAINNRTEPFIRRFELNDPAQHLVFDSETHGDPATPLLNALLGDPVKFLVGKTADKARGLSFHLSDHQWRRFTGVPESPVIGVDDKFTVGKSGRLDLLGGAGGPAEKTGDFLYGELKERRRLEGGFWGIFRVEDQPNDFETLVQPLPSAGVAAEDRPGWVVFEANITGSGSTDLVVGVPSSDIGAGQGGSVYLFEGKSTDDVVNLADADILFVNTTAMERAGTDISFEQTRRRGVPNLVVEKARGRPVEIPGGRNLTNIIDSPPQSDIATFVDNTTNNDIGAIVPLEMFE